MGRCEEKFVIVNNAYFNMFLSGDRCDHSDTGQFHELQEDKVCVLSEYGPIT